MALLLQDCTPLMEARSVDAVQLLLSYGANPAATNHFVSTHQVFEPFEHCVPGKASLIVAGQSQHLLTLMLTMLHDNVVLSLLQADPCF